jgi:hypothetical protein
MVRWRIGSRNTGVGIGVRIFQTYFVFKYPTNTL